MCAMLIAFGLDKLRFGVGVPVGNDGGVADESSGADGRWATYS